MPKAALTTAAALLLVALSGCQASSPRTSWGDDTIAVATRLARYGRALRCEWPLVAAWTCPSCKELQDAQLIDSYVISDQYDDASDAFTIHNDPQLKGLVVTFRSTYGNKEGWLNNFLGAMGLGRKIGDVNYRLHLGFAATYYVTVKDVFVSKLKGALAQFPGSDIYMNGHSRGGAMATLATFDLVQESRQAVGLTDPKAQLKLYTFGQPRVGDAPFAAVIEQNVGERFRIVNSGDPTPHVPPRKAELDDSSSVLNRLVDGFDKLLEAKVEGAATRIEQAALTLFSPTTVFLMRLATRAAANKVIDVPVADIFRKMATTAVSDDFVHHGPMVAYVDYIAGEAVDAPRVQKYVVCKLSDLDPECEKERGLSMTQGYRRPAVYPFIFLAAAGDRMNWWPMFALLDHAWYMSVDVGNEGCMAMKPAGWWGWTVNVTTADKALAGTGSNDITIGWNCGTKAATNGLLHLDCGGLIAETEEYLDWLPGMDMPTCWEGGDSHVFGFEHHTGTQADKDALPEGNPADACSAKGPEVTVSALLGADWNSGWIMDSVVLTLKQTTGPQDAITTSTFGKCLPAAATDPPLTFPSSPQPQVQRFNLCKTAAWWKWKVSVNTGYVSNEPELVGLSSGPAEVQVELACGTFKATTNPIAWECTKGMFNANCFLRGQADNLLLEFSPGKPESSPFTADNYPIPACTAQGVKPALTLYAKTPIFSWNVTGVALELQYYVPYPGGPLYDVIVTASFKPCDVAKAAWVFPPSTGTEFQHAAFELCPTGPATTACASGNGAACQVVSADAPPNNITSPAPVSPQPPGPSASTPAVCNGQAPVVAFELPAEEGQLRFYTMNDKSCCSDPAFIQVFIPVMNGDLLAAQASIAALVPEFAQCDLQDDGFKTAAAWYCAAKPEELALVQRVMSTPTKTRGDCPEGIMFAYDLGVIPWDCNLQLQKVGQYFFNSSGLQPFENLAYSCGSKISAR